MWSDSHHAPRDRAVWLFLPCARWEANADGTPKNVQHECVVAKWDETQKVWSTKEGRHVYPSLWHPAPTNGPQPDAPDLT